MDATLRSTTIAILLAGLIAYGKEAAGNTVFADDYPGADLGAKINAADAALGSQGGEIDVRAATGTIGTAVSLGANHILRFPPGSYTQSATVTLNGSGSAVYGDRGTTLTNTTSNVTSIRIQGGVYFATINSLIVTRQSLGTSPGVGIDVGHGVQRVRLDNLSVSNHYDGIRLGETDDSEMANTESTGNSR